jgi:hypothetical protein
MILHNSGSMTMTTYLQFTVNQADFAHAVAGVRGATDAKSTMPVLGNVLIQARKGEIVIAGTDLVRTARRVVQDEDAKIEAPGEITVPAKTLHEALGVLPDGPVTLIVDEGEDKTLRTTLRAGRARLSIPSLPAKDFPKLPIIPPGIEAQSDPILRQTLALCAPFATTDESRVHMHGIGIHDGIMAATDGHCAIFVRYQGAFKDAHVPPSFPSMIPSQGTCEFVATGKHLFVRTDEGVSSVVVNDGMTGSSCPAMILVEEYLDKDQAGYSWLKVKSANMIEALNLCQVGGQDSSTPSVHIAVKDSLLTMHNDGADASVDIDPPANKHKFTNKGAACASILCAIKILIKIFKAMPDEPEIGLPTGVLSPILVRVQTQIDGVSVTSIMAVAMPMGQS